MGGKREHEEGGRNENWATKVKEEGRHGDGRTDGGSELVIGRGILDEQLTLTLTLSLT